MTRFTQKRDEVTLIEERHQSIFKLMAQIYCCVDFELPENFKILVLAMEQTFGNEQRLMEKSGFPAIKCHLEQHARVLAALHMVHRRVMQGDNGLARRVGGQLLPDWFKLHTETLDQALFVWIALNKNCTLIQLLNHQIWKKQKALSETRNTQRLKTTCKAGYINHS